MTPPKPDPNNPEETHNTTNGGASPLGLEPGQGGGGAMSDKNKIGSGDTGSVPRKFPAGHMRRAEEALRLLQYAIESGKNVDDRVIERLNNSANTILCSSEASVDDCIEFEKAYRDLLDVTDPVTYLTLSASDANYGTRKWGATTATRWSAWLWLLTVSLAAYIVIHEGEELKLAKFSQLSEESPNALVVQHQNVAMRQLVLPYFYGALGALTYLLRRCHSLIHFRTFDPLRRGEYLNRILLGALSGGMILLFIDPQSLDLTQTTRVTGVSLAFLTGYNCDFLFTTLERIAAAILPKIGGEVKP